jgi:hypothetical protein
VPRHKRRRADSARVEVALFAHRQNDRHENEDNRRLIDEHRKGGGDEQYCDLQEEFVVSTALNKRPPIISAAPVRTMAALNTNIAVTSLENGRLPGQLTVPVLSDPARRAVYDREAEEIPVRRGTVARPAESVIMRRRSAGPLIGAPRPVGVERISLFL